MEREAMFYYLDGGVIHCKLCPHKCILKEGSTGICNARRAEGGKLKTQNYGMVSSMALDPIEKKPLYHYKPKSMILSIGSYGCNFNCGFCQNYKISKQIPYLRYISPESMVKYAIDLKNDGNIGIAFTYNEPFISYEYIYNTSRLIKEKGMDVIIVTNGYVNSEPLIELLPYIDAMNIDLKAFSNEFYKSVCNGKLEDVLKTIEIAYSKCHLEITTLLVNGYNDSIEEIDRLSKWISDIDENIPLHLTRYYPSYRFKEPKTPVTRVLDCVKEARKYLRYVYPGNIPFEDTNRQYFQ